MAGQQTKMIIITSDEDLIRQISLNKTANTRIVDLDRPDELQSIDEDDQNMMNLAFLAELSTLVRVCCLHSIHYRFSLSRTPRVIKSTNELSTHPTTSEPSPPNIPRSQLTCSALSAATERSASTTTCCRVLLARPSFVAMHINCE